MTKRLRQIPSDRELPAAVECPHAEDGLRHRGTGEALPPLLAHQIQEPGRAGEALCIIAMLLVAVAALRLGVLGKARLIATFGW